MPEFRVTVEGGRAKAEYRIWSNTHGHAAGDAAIEALKTYAGHGQGSFPFGDKITVLVEKVEMRPLSGPPKEEESER